MIIKSLDLLEDYFESDGSEEYDTTDESEYDNETKNEIEV
jgi:hypothetical protein